MKGVQGLILAAFLGAVAAVLNWVYLHNKTRQIESLSLLGVSAGATIKPGERFHEGHLVEVTIPKVHASSNLRDFVYLYKDLNTMVGVPATREYQGGDLIYREDYRRPAPELKLAANERLIWIPVDNRSFVPELANPGDKITFLVPTAAPLASPSPTARPSEANADNSLNANNPINANNFPEQNPSVLSQSPSPGGTEMIGPFRIGSLGNRLGSVEVMRANRVSQVNERQVGIIVKDEGTPLAPRLEPNAVRLLEALRRVNFSNIGVALHPREQAGSR